MRLRVVAGLAILVAAGGAASAQAGNEDYVQNKAHGITYRYFPANVDAGSGNAFPACLSNKTQLIGGGFFNDGQFGTGFLRSMFASHKRWWIAWDSPADDINIRFTAICAKKSMPTHVRSKAITLGPGRTTKQAWCPNGTWPYSGGLRDSDHVGGAVNVVSEPADSDDAGDNPDGWEVVADDSNVVRGAKVVVTCGEDKPVYTHGTTTVEGGAQGDAHAECPKNHVLYGGGFWTDADEGDARINSAAPDLKGSETDPRQWRVYLDNHSAGQVQAQAIAVCGPWQD